MIAQLFRLALAAAVMSAVAPSQAANEFLQDTGNPPVAVEIALERSELVLHEPVEVVLTIRNSGSQTVEVDLGMDRKTGIALRVTSPDGTVKIGRVPVHGGISRREKIKLRPAQSYTQNLVLNDWTEFSQPGLYHIVVSFDNPVLMQEGTSINLGPTNIAANFGSHNDDVVRRFCDDNLRRLLAADSYDRALVAAQVLSHVQDPVAVPCLQRAFRSPYHIDSLLVDGLEKIGTDDAIEVLLRISSATSVAEAGHLRSALVRLAAKTKNANLRSRIYLALLK